MAYAFGFPRDVTQLVDSLWDWRYRLVRGGGKPPSASAMPLPVPPHAGHEPITTNMEHGKVYIQRIEHACDAWGRGPLRVNINIWELHTPHGWHIWAYGRCPRPIRSFDSCSSKDVRPRDLAVLWNACDACEPLELQLQRSWF